MMGQSRLHLGGEPASVVAAQTPGANLTIGFRPEHLELANGTGDQAMRFPAVVDVVEYLGNEELIHARAEGNDIVALLPSDRKVKAGDNVELAVPLGQLFVFDPESEKALVS
jgi:ABC-type sugar transport system ATPase subunit